MAEDTPEYEGQLIRIGKREYTVPALSFQQLQKFEDEIAAIENDLQAAIAARKNPLSIFRRQLPIIHAAISRNYPQLKLEDLADQLDLRQSRKVYQAVMGISDIDLASVKKAGGVTTPGKEAAAAATN